MLDQRSIASIPDPYREDLAHCQENFQHGIDRLRCPVCRD